jgi:hypothetical protein
VPALILGTRLDGIRGAAISHALIGLAVAVPITLVMLHRVGVGLAPIAPTLGRPLLAGAFGGAVAFVVARVIGEPPFVQLSAAGASGLLVYLAVALPPDRFRQLLGMMRREEARAVD